MKVGIVITVKDCVEYTKQCIETIVTNEDYVIVVVDDFSEDDTKEYLKELSQSRNDIIVLTDLETYSLAEKWNMGIDAAVGDGCDAFLICNNDILFNKHTIDQLVKRLDLARETAERIGMVTAHNRKGSLSTDEIENYPLAEEGTESPGPDFSCFLLDKRVFDEVGEFDDGYIPCYFEDNDYHIRMIQSNWRAISTTTAPYYHYGSVTQNSLEGGLCSGPQFDANRDYFRNKFGFAPGDPEYDKFVQTLEKTYV